MPASSANLGPGFDSVGCALGRLGHLPGHRHRGRPASSSRSTGEGAGAVPLDATHLVHRAMQVAWAELGVEPPGGPAPRVPQRGAARAGDGVVGDRHRHRHRRRPGPARRSPAGRAGGRRRPRLRQQPRLPPRGPPRQRLGERARRRDPVVERTTSGATTTTVHLPVHPDVEPVVFAPDAQLSTAKARSVLPQQVRLADAAANSARAALLAHALGAAPEHLLAATRDWLHQEARRSLVRRVDGARRRACAPRATPPSSRGAGPSVLVLAPARPGRRGAGARRCRVAGADPRHPGRTARASRCSSRRLTGRRQRRGRPRGVRCGRGAFPRCYSGPCDRSRCRVSLPLPAASRPPRPGPPARPCAAVPGVGSR